MAVYRTTILVAPLIFTFSGLVGCEDLGGETTSASPGGAQSALGKAKEKAQRTVDQINRHQQDLVRQADTVFDDQAARRLEAERRAADRGD